MGEDAMIRDDVEGVKRTSLSIIEEHIKQLRSIFPEAFSEGKIDFEKLKAALGDIVDRQPEKYSFTWAGKRNSIQLLQAPYSGPIKRDNKRGGCKIQ